MTALSQASIKLTTRCLIEWQLHTMVRPSEAAGTRWSEVDLNTELWEIPIARMKQKKPHVVPLTPPSDRVTGSDETHKLAE
jgi:integrase